MRPRNTLMSLATAGEDGPDADKHPAAKALGAETLLESGAELE